MPYANLQVSLTEAQKQSFINDINNIVNAMPYLVNLTEKEMKSFLRFGKKSDAFLIRALELAEQNPQVLIAAFSISGFKQDVEAVLKLKDILVQVKKLADALNSTVTALEIEATRQATFFYGLSKSAAKQDVPGAQTIVEELKPFMPSTGRIRKKK